MSSLPTRVPGYDLAAPTESDALASLQRVFGSARGTQLWTDACRLAGLAPGNLRTTADLERATQTLGSQGGAAATVARSIGIRIRTHTQLMARSAAANSGARR